MALQDLKPGDLVTVRAEIEPKYRRAVVHIVRGLQSLVRCIEATDEKGRPIPHPPGFEPWQIYEDLPF